MWTKLKTQPRPSSAPQSALQGHTTAECQRLGCASKPRQNAETRPSTSVRAVDGPKSEDMQNRGDADAYLHRTP